MHVLVTFVAITAVMLTHPSIRLEFDHGFELLTRLTRAKALHIFIAVTSFQHVFCERAVLPRPVHCLVSEALAWLAVAIEAIHKIRIGARFLGVTLDASQRFNCRK